jgi:tripartite ATP-independent transporter DctM subunit
MVKRGYAPEFAAGITASAATMGMVIPPSIPMIMYSMISGDSIGALFIAGLVPGALMAALMIGVCYVISEKRGYHPKKEKFDPKDFAKTMLYGLPAVIMPVLIIITISFGIATASESAAIAVLYCLILGGIFYRKLKWKALVVALKRTLVMTAAINIIIGFSTIFTWLMTKEHVPQIVADFFADLNLPNYATIAILVVLILVIGTAIDVSPAILMLTPILLPVATQAGISTLQFGVMYIVGNALGLLTPPVGMLLNVINKVTGIPVMKIFNGSMPFLICDVAVLILTAFIPALSVWLPTVISY